MGWENDAKTEIGSNAASDYSETDLRKMAENAKTFDGKPLDESDIVAIQNIIEGVSKR